jgi:hypothetical protein
MGRIVISVYKPKSGQEQALEQLVARHWPILEREGLVTDRAPIAMRAADGTIVEVFEWRSAEAIEAAHRNPVVGALWEAFGKVADFIPVGAVPEAAQMFSEFSAL